MFVHHDSIQELPGAPQDAPFPTASLRVACLPEYFMYYNYLKRLGTRQDISGDFQPQWQAKPKAQLYLNMISKLHIGVSKWRSTRNFV
jgi:hypothetical protein